jgi:hypothetical protein
MGMKPLFTEEELRALRRLDEGLERPPLGEGERMEADARDVAILREREAPGQGLLTLPEGWFERERTARFPTTEEAARACRVSTKLMWHLECGSVTAPELAKRIGCALGLTKAQVRAITCARTAARRVEEARGMLGERRGSAPYPARGA